MPGGAAGYVRSYIPRASKHLPRELALPGSWSRYLVPTCTSRLWEDEVPTAMAAPHSPIDDAKRAMRAERQAARAGNDPVAAGEGMTAHVLRDCPPGPGAVVSGFWPLGDEIDIRPLLLALHARGHPIVLPVTPKRGLPLTFRLWRPGDVLIAERFGTMRPAGEQRSPDFLLVPMLAVSTAQRRPASAGYGAGYHDPHIVAAVASLSPSAAPSPRRRCPRFRWGLPTCGSTLSRRSVSSSVVRASSTLTRAHDCACRDSATS